MLTFIKQELFLLGLISMLLTAVQGSMLKICIPDGVAAYGLNWKPQSKVPVFIDESIEYSTSYMEDEASKDGRRLLGLLGRHLLGGPPKGDYNKCGKGRQPLFSAYMMHQVHLLIFLFAVVHVLYVFGTLMICLVQIRQWRRWEAEAPAADAFLRMSDITAPSPRAPPSRAGGGARAERATRRARASAKALWVRVGSSGLAHAGRVALAVVTSDLVFSPVTRAVYYSLRLLFIARLNLDQSFDFAAFVERSIEEHLPHLMKLNAAMMCLAAALLSFPFPAYLPYWLFGLSVVTEFVLAGKLASISTLAAAQKPTEQP
ncbi:MLO-like protein 12 [Monoraphidium neglectum]|uniref:MLO-like protein 12 n=1 Tax=Monoraphidium neglectum TaxID=145388 RepID=A0A0D2LKW2_9CHLO|nr:MLO-like protein 12 [Monoraphidium neglectum]KIZ07029.1 MLO-like protein 12 [Monoraphidium neglectum]|eukprot:XP_013906048.1 MLO-like protein 12 [Monoraphidium neglectum]